MILWLFENLVDDIRLLILYYYIKCEIDLYDSSVTVPPSGSGKDIGYVITTWK